MKEPFFQVWKSCLNHLDYLVNHSSNGIFDATTAFPDPENVDFDVLYAILLTFWVNFIISYLCYWRPSWIFPLWLMSPSFSLWRFFAHPFRTLSA